MRHPYREMRLSPTVYTWTVEITVPAHVVAEGFALDNERAHAAMLRAYPLLEPHEIQTTVIDAPSDRVIEEEIDHA